MLKREVRSASKGREENMKSRFAALLLPICIGMALGCITLQPAFSSENKATFVVG